MKIKDYWDHLDEDTKKWLIDNPGCQILPRTITTVVSQAVGESVSRDRHGEMVLSQEDHDFIRAKANESLSA